MDQDKQPERDRVTTTAKHDSPIGEAIDSNNELLMAVDKQVEVLASRLEYISSSEPTPPSDSAALASRGNSSLANRIHQQGSQLATISDRLSYITRILEI